MIPALSLMALDDGQLAVMAVPDGPVVVLPAIRSATARKIEAVPTG